jgi:hypothetical protein
MLISLTATVFCHREAYVQQYGSGGQSRPEHNNRPPRNKKMFWLGAALWFLVAVMTVDLVRRLI